jgi:hypothetical protein
MYPCHRSLSHWLALCLFSALPTLVFADEPPARALIGGVPFVSMKEGCAIEHPSLMFQHPSSRAAHMMALRYHRPQAKTWEDYRKATDEQKGPLREKWGDAKSLDELRALLAAGNPVIVVTTRTPYAHDLYGVFEMALAAGAQMGVNLEDLDSQDYSSRILGRMVGLDVQRKIEETALVGARMNPLHEIATRCGLHPC